MRRANNKRPRRSGAKGKERDDEGPHPRDPLKFATFRYAASCFLA